MGAKKPDTDWEAIKSIYRTDQASTREIARRYNISEKAIRIRAKSEGWAKDLATQVATGIKEAVIRSHSAKWSAAPSLLRRRAANIVKNAIEEGKDVVLKHQSLGKVLTQNSQLIADIINREIVKVSALLEMEMPEGMKLSDALRTQESYTKRLEVLAKAHDNIARASGYSVEIERKSRGLDDQPADPNAPPSISITYYRSDLTLQKIDQGGGG